jgi:PPK2 family polyphosphate:nucleotide phosphotransferase
MLKNMDTRAPANFEKHATKLKTKELLDDLNELQFLLYAEHKHALLVIIQGMDASGKDGLIKNVFGCMNPQGVMVKSFKKPSEEELSRDFLWRIHNHVPPKGMIQIFNRSHYEDILITRVHKWIDEGTVIQRIAAINHFEELLTNNHTHILKFYLHISPQEQSERLDERIHNPKKQWKYDENDLGEAKYWDEYMRMYEACFQQCNKIPWTIVPADQNWYKEHVVALAVRDLLAGLKMAYPQMKSKKSF